MLSSERETVNPISTTTTQTQRPTMEEQLEMSDHQAKLPRNGQRPNSKSQPRDLADSVNPIDHFPEASAQALQTFTQISQNSYQNKSLGITTQLEDVMICDCSWEPGDDPQWACGGGSGCINYLTQIECIQNQCRCGEQCQNQRFQQRQYAPIEIVLTPNKGFGMRIQTDVTKDTFVCEYLGEVIGLKTFQKRMKEYAEQGLKHFYFMELQRDQYIDATKKGGFGRFINHSCNPNCYIAKWVIGRQLRMGIFTKRSVNGGEELTFNYNVDRYGHEAQQCFCGEPNCVGYLGGKTQTDLGAMDELYIEALGIADDVEKLHLKGDKHKRSRSMDIDYTPVMKPILLKDVPRVSSAIRQSISNKRILTKLLRRIMITTDQAVQKQLMRLHGFSLMSMILSEYLSDQEVVKTALEILLKWPLITKNKILSTNIEETVMKLSADPSEMIQTLVAELIKLWVALEVSYRIPKDPKGKEGAEGGKRKAEVLLDRIFSKRLRDDSRRKDSNAGIKLVSEKTFIRPEAAKPIDPLAIRPEFLRLPADWRFERTAEGRPYYYHILIRQTQWSIPTPQDVDRVNKLIAENFQRQKAASINVDNIVAKAKCEAKHIYRMSTVASDQQKTGLVTNDCQKHINNKPHRSSVGESSSSQSSAKKMSHLCRSKKSKDLHPEEHFGCSTSSLDNNKVQITKNKKMLKLFSNVVVHAMSRYKSALDHDQFKRRARELTNILCEKEKKSEDYEQQTYDRISTSKQTKIKSFTKDWISKLFTRKGIAFHSSFTATGHQETDHKSISDRSFIPLDPSKTTPITVNEHLDVEFATNSPKDELRLHCEQTMKDPEALKSPSIYSAGSLPIDDSLRDHLIHNHPDDGTTTPKD